MLKVKFFASARFRGYNYLMSLIKAMATVGGLTGVSRILGFARDVLMAIVLGAGPVSDAFFVAQEPESFITTAREQ